MFAFVGFFILCSSRSSVLRPGFNFWAWNGEGRAQHADAWFKMGDRAYVGDPPQEEQGLYGLFDVDAPILAIVREHAQAVAALATQ